MFIQILKILPIIFIYLLATLAYLFFFWKRLKEDYTPSIIFSSGFVIVITVFITTLIVSLFYNHSGFIFWVGLGGFLLSFTFVRKKYKLRGFESFEASGIGLLALNFVYCLVFLLNHFNAFALLNSILPVLIFVLFNFIDSRYKRFTWYKSGRVGFSGFVSLAFYFLIRSFLVVFTPAHMLSFSGSIYLGKIDILFSGLVAGILLFCTYWLAKTK